MNAPVYVFCKKQVYTEHTVYTYNSQYFVNPYNEKSYYIRRESTSYYSLMEPQYSIRNNEGYLIACSYTMDEEEVINHLERLLCSP